MRTLFSTILVAMVLSGCALLDAPNPSVLPGEALIKGEDLIELIKQTLPDSDLEIAGVEADRNYVVFHLNTLWNFLMGPTLWREEIYMKKYVSLEDVEKLGVSAQTCTDYAKQTDLKVKAKVPKAAFGVLAHKGIDKKIFWKLRLKRKPHRECWFAAVEGGKVRLFWIEPQDPKLWGPLEDKKHIRTIFGSG